MIKVGVIGLGMMGSTHVDVYRKRKDVRLVAISDKNPELLSGKRQAQGNIEGQAQGGGLPADLKRYAEGMELIRDPEIELVDICLPTPLHTEYAVAALQAGKHVMLEKPMARTFAATQPIIEAARTARGMIMVGMCMRFWPGWTELKKIAEDQTYGKLISAKFRRAGGHPPAPFYQDGEACGGALLDLHIHDSDFIHYCFGMPKAVSSYGISKTTTEVDHVVTRYDYGNDTLVVAEGAWMKTPSYGFQMRYTVEFERAVLEFDIGSKTPLVISEPGKAARPVDVLPAMGYDLEIDYFLNCIAQGVKPRAVTLESAAASLKLVEAELQSIRSGAPVTLA